MILPMILLVVCGGFVFALCAVGESAERQSRDISCRCGAMRVRVICVDPVDAAYYAESFTENCLYCRSGGAVDPIRVPNRDRKGASSAPPSLRRSVASSLGQEVDCVH